MVSSARFRGCFLRFFVALAIVITILFALQKQTFAQTSSQAPSQSSTSSYYAPNVDANVPHTNHVYAQSVISEVLSAMICQLVNMDIFNNGKACLQPNPITHKLGFMNQTNQPGGIIGLASHMIIGLYTPPLGGTDYFRYLSQNFGIVKPTYAATEDIGFNSLRPLLKMWIATRNIAYLGFVVIFIVIGLAIMLRIKIDPRTVMTIQNQIPRIIIAILLITFSYAIAGILVDLMWVATYFLINIISSMDTKPIVDIATKNIYTPPLGYVNEIFKGDDFGSVFGGILALAASTAGNLKGIFLNLFSNDAGKSFLESINLGAPNPATNPTFPTCNGFDPGCWAGEVIGKSILGTVGGLLSQIVGWLVSWFIGALAILIALVAIIFALLRIWFTLIKSYLLILVDVALAPLWILFGVLPGSKNWGFTPWLRHLSAQLAVFPVTLSIFLFAKALIDNFDVPLVQNCTSSAQNAQACSNSIFTPPLIGNPGGPNNFSALLAFGAILLAPTAINMVRDAFKVSENKYASSIRQGYMGAAQGASALASGPWEMLTRKQDAIHSEGLGRTFARERLTKPVGEAVTSRIPGVAAGAGRIGDWLKSGRRGPGPHP